MNYEDMESYIVQGGIGWLPSYSPDDCVWWTGTQVLKYHGNTSVGLPSTLDMAAQNWVVSDNHTDKPPRKP